MIILISVKTSTGTDLLTSDEQEIEDIRQQLTALTTRIASLEARKQIPSGGATRQLLGYGGSSGTAKWVSMNTISDDLINAMCKWVDGGEVIADIDEGTTNTPKVLDNYGLASVWTKLDAKVSELQDLIDQLNGKIDWRLYHGTNCTVYYADNVGMGVRVIASGLTLQPGSVNSNVVATLPSQAAFFGTLALPCALMASNWVSTPQNCTLSFSSATKEIRARISGNASVSDAVINGFFFFPPALAYAG